MPIESKDSDVPPLQGNEDYSRWARHAEAELQSHNCRDAISPTAAVAINNDAAIDYFTNLGIAARNITTTMTVSWMESQLCQRRKEESKAVGILKKLVGEKNKQMIEGKSALEVWDILKDKFKNTSPMSQIDALRKATLIHMSNFNDARSYCNAYEAALDQISGMLQPNSVVNQQFAEAVLQGCMLANVTDTYKPLISQLRKDWTPTNTSLSETCLSIVRYDSTTANTNIGTAKTLLTAGTSTLRNRGYAAPKGSCDFDKCVKNGLTTHPKEKCWKKYPDQRPKHLLSGMRTRGTHRGNRNTDTSQSATASAPVSALVPASALAPAQAANITS